MIAKFKIYPDTTPGRIFVPFCRRKTNFCNHISVCILALFLGICSRSHSISMLRFSFLVPPLTHVYTHTAITTPIRMLISRKMINVPQNLSIRLTNSTHNFRQYMRFHNMKEKENDNFYSDQDHPFAASSYHTSPLRSCQFYID